VRSGSALCSASSRVRPNERFDDNPRIGANERIWSKQIIINGLYDLCVGFGTADHAFPMGLQHVLYGLILNHFTAMDWSASVQVLFRVNEQCQ